MSEPKNVHAGHREKLRKKFLKNKDFSNMEEHEILELLLFYALPRVNTNIIAHELINECRGLDRVFTAPREQLKAVDGVGDKVCDYIDILSAFVRYCNSYEVTDMSKLKSDNVIKYFKNLFYGRANEALYLICLNAKGRIIKEKLMSEGGFESANVNITSIVRDAVMCDAAGVVLAHNHPSGRLEASGPDISVTNMVEKALANVGVKLIEHVIATDEGCIGVKDMERRNNVRKVYKF